MNELSWHQKRALQRQFQTRHLPAHIREVVSGKGWVALCGVENPQVYIEPEHRRNAANKPCKKCVAEADKREAAAKEAAAGE